MSLYIERYIVFNYRGFFMMRFPRLTFVSPKHADNDRDISNVSTTYW